MLSLISHQEQASHVQTQLNEEEQKNSKLLQQIAKLEEQITLISQESDRKDEVDFPSSYTVLILNNPKKKLLDVWELWKKYGALIKMLFS